MLKLSKMTSPQKNWEIGGNIRGLGPRNKFVAQLLDSLGPASYLEKIFFAHIGNYKYRQLHFFYLTARIELGVLFFYNKKKFLSNLDF